ncbi:type II toxin-antitoxin system VapC family toxin [Sphingomonas canadensis]|uniref:Type II toxin-antitoxin system VapC family toxin n=1 Tax=Sphingomonas canadensis TaxID=1219257 RepID=A0ABW3H538_9SPHN|nr:type II toxin-antitoxin system VapC family toxin [Sphingomonas canadensis]MCW3836263.1 type II toxin-antitoxin system VapC family toxin [Sphingomonas canadensis]
MSEAAFDTGILLDLLAGVVPAQRELERFPRRYVSRLSWIEVMTRALPEDGNRAKAFLDYFSIVELSEEIARRAAVLRSERRGLPVADAVILASAQVHGRILVTRNTKDFPATLPGIRVPYTL